MILTKEKINNYIIELKLYSFLNAINSIDLYN